MTSHETDESRPERPPQVYSVAIVDDDPVVRAHFRDIIEQCPRLSLNAEASSLASATEMITSAPDLVLLDIGLPDGSGLELIPVIRSRGDAFVLIVTSFGDRETVVSALQAGADGYLLKDSDAATVLAGIEATLEGGAPISPAAAVYLLDSLRTPVAAASEKAEETDEGHTGRLTPRETELLKLFAKGASYKEAARTLEISPLTVGNYVKSIYRKLEVNSRGEAVYRAMEAGHIKIQN